VASSISGDLQRRPLRKTKSLRNVAARLQKVISLPFIWDIPYLVFDDVIQVKYTDEITLVVGNEACDLDSGGHLKTR